MYTLVTGQLARKSYSTMKWMHHEVACVSNVDNLGSFSWFACARSVSQERDGLWTYG